MEYGGNSPSIKGQNEDMLSLSQSRSEWGMDSSKDCHIVATLEHCLC